MTGSAVDIKAGAVAIGSLAPVAAPAALPALAPAPRPHLHHSLSKNPRKTRETVILNKISESQTAGLRDCGQARVGRNCGFSDSLTNSNKI
jgi:hypothetical protein